MRRPAWEVDLVNRSTIQWKYNTSHLSITRKHNVNYDCFASAFKTLQYFQYAQIRCFFKYNLGIWRVFSYFNFDVKMFSYSQKQFYRNTEVLNRELFHTASILSGHCSHISKLKLQGSGTLLPCAHRWAYSCWHLYLYTFFKVG